MSIKTRLNYTTNFYSKKRRKKEIKFLILHYTGMKSEKLAIKKLTEIQLAAERIENEAKRIRNNKEIMEELIQK